jgi:HK97 family phage portal protein
MNPLDRLLFKVASKRADKIVSAQILPATNNQGYLGSTTSPPQYGNIVTWQGQDGINQVTNGYCANDIVYGIIRKIAEKAKKAPWAEFRVKSNIKYSLYKALLEDAQSIKDWAEVFEIKDQALEIVDSGTKITDLLLRPNNQDTWGDLVEAAISFKLITGNSYVYGKTILAGKNAGMPNSLHILPSQYMSVIAFLNSFPIEVTGYQLYMQFLETFTKEEIMHDKYFNPQWTIVGAQLYGLSPLQAAAKVLTRSNSGKSAAVSAYNNGGPRVAIFVNDDRYDPNQATQEAVAIRKKLSSFQGTDAYNQAIASGYKLGSIPLGLSPVDLDLLNAENFDLRALCRVYNVPAPIMGDTEGTTYNNIKDAQKALTTDAAIPALCSLRDNFNRKFQKDWNAKGNVIDFDISCYQELQEGKGDTVDWLNKSALPLERWYEVMGEKLPNWMDEETKRTILIPSTMTTLNDIQNPPINLPPDLNPYNKPKK